MIQRIQTLWMALTAALMCAVLLVPTVWGSIFTAFLLPVCAGVATGFAALLPGVAIFLYKKRRLQMSLLVIEFILILAAAGSIGWYIWTTRNHLESGFWFSFYPVLIATVALLTNWFALRGVRKDEKLVRSVDRIR